MTLTQDTARAALQYLATMTPEQAAHDCTISLTAIRPYTDRRLERLRDVFRWMANRPERRQRDLSAMRIIAESADPRAELAAIRQQ